MRGLDAASPCLVWVEQVGVIGDKNANDRQIRACYWDGDLAHGTICSSQRGQYVIGFNVKGVSECKPRQIETLC